MTHAINVEEIKRKVDYKSLAQEIVAQSQTGCLKRQNPVAELLNPVKDALIAARQNGARIRSLAVFLKQRGVPISEASLRRYLRERINGVRTRSAAHGRTLRTANAVATKHPDLGNETLGG